MKARLVFTVSAVVAFASGVLAQAGDCTFKPPSHHIHFGSGQVADFNTASLVFYNRVSTACPTDGHYSYVAATSNCFRGDWHTLTADHTPGDAGGNMLLVNSAYSSGNFFQTKIKGLKKGATYQFGVWLMNVCRPTDKCPFPLLPRLTVRLQTPAGRTVAQFATGDLPRRKMPQWSEHIAHFTMPANATDLLLTLTNSATGGCGNDFALDDITFRECKQSNPARVVETRKVPPVTAKKVPPTAKKSVQKRTPSAPPVGRQKTLAGIPVPETGRTIKPEGPQRPALTVVPAVLKQRTNTLVKTIELEAGEILLELYDNGEIDGDTVSIYHNNQLIIAAQRLSQKPISFRVKISKGEPHHELVMVAENLGSIPPNTSLMMVTTEEKRYQVFISSTKQQNAKVIFQLKQ